MTSVSATYPTTLEHAAAIIEQLRLSPSETIIEPSRWVGYLFGELSAATGFRLMFGAERLPYNDPAQFLMYVPDDEEIEPWLASCGGAHESIEFVVVRFWSEEDRARFEGMLSPTN